MATSSNLIAVLILFLAGCEESPATVPQRPSEATEQTQTPVEPLKPTTPPESAAELIEQAHQITGKVIHIVDGDTMDILTEDKTTIRIRLNSVDAPETGQPFGKNAKQYLSDTIGGHIVTVVPHDKDRYGRTIRDVFLEAAAGPNFRRCKTINYRIGIVNIGPKLDTFGYAGSKYSAMDSREVYSDRWGS